MENGKYWWKEMKKTKTMQAAWPRGISADFRLETELIKAPASPPAQKEAKGGVQSGLHYAPAFLSC